MSKQLQFDLNERFYIFDNFILENASYFLELEDMKEKVEAVFFQLSIEHGNNSPLSLEADKYEEDGHVDWDYLKDMNRREKFKINPLKFAFYFHFEIQKVSLTIDNNLLVYMNDNIYEIFINEFILLNYEVAAFTILDDLSYEEISDIEQRDDNKGIMTIYGNKLYKIILLDKSNNLIKDELVISSENESKDIPQLDGVETHKNYIKLKNGDLFCYGNILDRDVIIRDAKTLEQKAIIKGHGGNPVFLQELSNGDIVTVSYQRAFRILRDYKEIYKLDELHNDEVLGFLYDETNNELISYSKDKTVKKFEIDFKYNPLEQPNLRNLAICTDFEDCILISGVFLNKISRADYKIVQTNEEHQAPVVSIAKINDQYFATASMDATIKIFDVDTFESVLTLEFEDKIPLLGSIKIENKFLIYAKYGKTAYIVNETLDTEKVDKDDYKEQIKNQEPKEVFHQMVSINGEKLQYKDSSWYSDKEKELLFVDDKRDVICIKDGKKSIKFLKLISSYYLVLDLESTCADDNSIKDEDREIIEIGAVMIEKISGKVVDQFQSFVKPSIHKKLTPFCRKLTTITQDDVDNAKSFPEVMDEFEKWFSNYRNFTFASWGSYDEWQFKLDCERAQYKYPFVNHLNVRELYSKYIGSDEKYTIPDALQYFGLEFGGTYHRGIDDAKNIVKILNKIKGTK